MSWCAATFVLSTGDVRCRGRHIRSLQATRPVVPAEIANRKGRHSNERPVGADLRHHQSGGCRHGGEYPITPQAADTQHKTS